MKLSLSLIILLLLCSFVVLNKKETIYNKIVKESFVFWKGSHLDNFGSHNGTVRISEGVLKVKRGKLVSANFAIDMASVAATDLKDKKEHHNKLIEHLLSQDFFNVSKYANAIFTLTELKKSKGEHNSKVTGNVNYFGSRKEYYI